MRKYEVHPILASIIWILLIAVIIISCNNDGSTADGKEIRYNVLDIHEADGHQYVIYISGAGGCAVVHHEGCTNSKHIKP